MERLFAALERLPDDQLAGVLPIVLLMLAPRLARELPAPLAATLGAFERSLQLADNASDDDKKRALDRHMAAHGITGEVWRGLLASMRDVGDVDGTALAHKLIASERISGALERTAPPPPGTVGAGPFARFDLEKKKKKP